MKLTRKKKVVLGIILASYATTWILAPPKVRAYLKADALALYERARVREKEQKEEFVKHGLIKESEESNIHQNGPSSGLDWSISVAPCFLLAHDYYVIGPLWGAGHLSLYFYYGSNVIRIGKLRMWIS